MEKGEHGLFGRVLVGAGLLLGAKKGAAEVIGVLKANATDRTKRMAFLRLILYHLLIRSGRLF